MFKRFAIESDSYILWEIDLIVLIDPAHLAHSFGPAFLEDPQNLVPSPRYIFIVPAPLSVFCVKWSFSYTNFHKDASDASHTSRDEQNDGHIRAVRIHRESGATTAQEISKHP